MRKSLALLGSVMLLSAGCATVPAVCPVLPPPPPKVELGPTFSETMRNFLSGNLPEPTPYALPSSGARLGQKR